MSTWEDDAAGQNSLSWVQVKILGYWKPANKQGSDQVPIFLEPISFIILQFWQIPFFPIPLNYFCTPETFGVHRARMNTQWIHWSSSTASSVARGRVSSTCASQIACGGRGRISLKNVTSSKNSNRINRSSNNNNNSDKMKNVHEMRSSAVLSIVDNNCVGDTDDANDDGAWTKKNARSS